MGMGTGMDNDDERMLIERVCRSLLGYSVSSSFCLASWERTAARLRAVAPGDAAGGDESCVGDVGRMEFAARKIDGMASAARDCIAANQRCLEEAVSRQLPDATFSGPPVVPKEEDASKVRYLLKNMLRDWSEEGAAERQESYGRMLKLLEEHVPRSSRVLVPGAGLGRLVFECYRRGYEVEGNEWSYYMLFGSSMLLNCEPGDRWSIHPFALESSNVLCLQDQMRSCSVPDVCPCLVRPETADSGVAAARATSNDAAMGSSDVPFASMAMCGGDFAEVYAAVDMKERFDAVLTCFFIDTARNVAEYIDVIWHCLRQGGVWINLGPLQYQWSDSVGVGSVGEEGEMSVELNLSDILEVARRRGFTCETYEIIPSVPYVSNVRSLRQNRFSCAFFMMKKVHV